MKNTFRLLAVLSLGASLSTIVLAAPGADDARPARMGGAKMGGMRGMGAGRRS